MEQRTGRTRSDTARMAANARWAAIAHILPDEGCATCGGSLPPKRATGPRSIYCSKACSSRASYRRRRDAGTLSRPPRTPPAPRVCVFCGSAFESVRIRDCCSTSCQSRLRDSTTMRRCSELDCEEPYRAKGLCAKHWRRKARAEGRESPDPWSDRRKSNWKKRQALKMGSEVEGFRYVEVFERDGWECGICFGSVDPELAWPDPMSASLDHIKPLSKGGAHAPDNAQCAHLVCNIRKGNREAA